MRVLCSKHPHWTVWFLFFLIFSEFHDSIYWHLKIVDRTPHTRLFLVHISPCAHAPHDSRSNKRLRIKPSLPSTCHPCLMSFLRCSRDFILLHCCLLLPFSRLRPRQHHRAITLRRSHEIRSTVVDRPHPNLSHEDGVTCFSESLSHLRGNEIPFSFRFVIAVSIPLLFVQDQRTSNVLARISARTSKLWNTILFVSLRCPIDVVQRWHEDDTISKFFWFNVPSLQITLDPVKNLQWWKSWENIPFELPLGLPIFFLGVNIFDLDSWVQVNSVKQPINFNSVSSWHVSHCWISAFNNHFDYCFVTFKNLQLKLTMRRICVCGDAVHMQPLVNFSVLPLFEFGCVSRIVSCLTSVYRWRVSWCFRTVRWPQYFYHHIP